MAPRYLLDTNTVSYFLSHRPPQVRQHMDRVGLEATAVSAITEAELRYGLAKRHGAATQRNAVETFLDNAAIVAWDSATARVYGMLRAEQEQKGRPLATASPHLEDIRLGRLHPEPEGCSEVGLAVGRDGSAMAFHDAAHGGQSDPFAGEVAISMQAVEHSEEPLDPDHVESHSVVSH